MEGIFSYILTGCCFFVLGWYIRGIKESYFKIKMSKALDDCFEAIKKDRSV